jgi:hypothetical protein
MYMKKTTQNEEELMRDLSIGRNNLNKTYLEALVNSIPKRIAAVIKHRG